MLSMLASCRYSDGIRTHSKCGNSITPDRLDSDTSDPVPERKLQSARTNVHTIQCQQPLVKRPPRKLIVSSRKIAASPIANSNNTHVMEICRRCGRALASIYYHTIRLIDRRSTGSSKLAQHWKLLFDEWFISILARMQMLAHLRCTTVLTVAGIDGFNTTAVISYLCPQHYHTIACSSTNLPPF